MLEYQEIISLGFRIMFNKPFNIQLDSIIECGTSREGYSCKRCKTLHSGQLQ